MSGLWPGKSLAVLRPGCHKSMNKYMTPRTAKDLPFIISFLMPRAKANAVSMSRNLETAWARGKKLIINESLTTAGAGLWPGTRCPNL